VRISAVCFKVGRIARFDDFAEHVIGLTRRAAEATPDLILFPEMLTFELLGLTPEGEFAEKFAQLPRFTPAYRQLFQELSRQTGAAIVGGTHPESVQGRIYNTATLFTSDGGCRQQQKCHLIPMEALLVTAGSGIDVFQTGAARIAILTCYDLEFPEAARIAVLKGVEIILSPSATLGPAGYWRVRHCAQARCIENQVYVVHCSLLGEVAGLCFWGRAAMLSPCDRNFPADGVLAQSEINMESILTTDVDLEQLQEIRKHGEVRTLSDIRPDLVNELARLASR
jgi:predicted amidohydrolase